MKFEINGETEVPVNIPTLDGKNIAEVITIKVPCHISEKSGEVFLRGEALRMIDKTKARYMGLMLPEEIKNLRIRLGLNQSEISELLQIGAKSYSRWENGRERPSRSINILLRALDDGKIDINYLKSIKISKKAKLPATLFYNNPEMQTLKVAETPSNYNQGAEQ
jgi:putative zinc finger/helix-turn-helix YgiT family protein